MAEPGGERPFTVLVVEDEWLLRSALTDFFEQAGWQVREAASGEAAVELLQQRDGIDIVCTDIRLTGPLNGWDVGEVSRATHPGIPVVYTSGAVVTPARPVSGSTFIPKPYRLEQVLTACRRLTDADG
jgi:DNA-binding NtrC family response regulator